MNFNISKLKLLSIAVVILFVMPFVVYGFPPLIGGNNSYIVKGSSMEPNIKPGDVIIVKEVDIDDVEVGDIVTYNRGSMKITHRVIERRMSNGNVISLITKGDATEGPDLSPVFEEELMGEMMFRIPMLGHIILYAGTFYGFIGLVIIPSIILVAMEINKVIKRSNKEKKEVKSQ